MRLCVERIAEINADVGEYTYGINALHVIALWMCCVIAERMRTVRCVYTLNVNDVLSFRCGHLH